VSAKRNVLKSQLPLIFIAATVCLLTLMWFVYRSLGHSRCDSIFEQTADRVHADLEFIKVKGGVTLGAEKVQELTDSSQKVGLHLKSCCIAQQSKALNTEQFQVCMSGAKDYQTQIIQVANNIKEADAAEKQQKPQLARQKAEAAKEAATKLLSAEKTLAKAIKTPPASPSAKETAEQEPNNTIPQANIAEMDTTIAGQINPADDVDYFKFSYNDAKKRRDIVLVRLDPSTTLQPSLALYKEDRSVDQRWTASNTAGAEDKFSFVAEPGKTYFVGVASNYSQTAGAYALSLKPQKAYDEYEPNDDPFTATPLKLGETIEANIMDGTDVDSYKLSGIKEKSITISLRNLSSSLKPSIRVLKSDKSIAQGWNSPNTQGADISFSIASEPGEEYFVQVTSDYGQSTGPYSLKVQ
jgi:hypothetical protein